MELYRIAQPVTSLTEAEALDLCPSLKNKTGESPWVRIGVPELEYKIENVPYAIPLEVFIRINPSGRYQLAVRLLRMPVRSVPLENYYIQDTHWAPNKIIFQVSNNRHGVPIILRFERPLFLVWPYDSSYNVPIKLKSEPYVMMRNAENWPRPADFMNTFSGGELCTGVFAEASTMKIDRITETILNFMSYSSLDKDYVDVEEIESIIAKEKENESDEDDIHEIIKNAMLDMVVYKDILDKAKGFCAWLFDSEWNNDLSYKIAMKASRAPHVFDAEVLYVEGPRISMVLP